MKNKTENYVLKINDKVDLAVLLKFGFKTESFQCGFFYRNYYVFYNSLQQPVISVDVKLRSVEILSKFYTLEDGIVVIYDLIQAGIIEKEKVEA